MNTTDNEKNGYIAIAEKYYAHMLSKNFDAMQECLHPDVVLISPLAEISGRDVVVAAAKNLSKILKEIEIRSKFSHRNQVMLAYDFMFPMPIGKLRAAALMDFNDGQISRIELFYDGRPFEQKKDEIFEKENS